MVDIEREWELKLQTGKTVTWTGKTGEDAAWRYVDCHREATIIAYRQPRYGIFPGVRPEQIID